MAADPGEGAVLRLIADRSVLRAWWKSDAASLVDGLLESGFRLESISQDGGPRARVEHADVLPLVAALRASGGHVDLLATR